MNSKFVRIALTVAAISVAGVGLAACNQHGRGHHDWNDRYDRNDRHDRHDHDRDRRDRDRDRDRYDRDWRR